MEKSPQEMSVIDKISKVKTNKEKSLINKISCPCAVPLTTRKAYDIFMNSKQNKNIPIIVYKGYTKINDKESLRDMIATPCSKPCQEGSQYCYIHNKQLKNGNEVTLYNDILPENNSESRFIENIDDIIFEKIKEKNNSSKDKKTTPKKKSKNSKKKKTIKINPIIFEDDEKYDQFLNVVKNLENDILQECNEIEESENSNSLEKSSNKKTNKNIIKEEEVLEENKEKIEEVIEEVEEEEERVETEEEEEEIDINKSDEEDEEDGEELESIETTDGREFFKKEDLIYSPEDINEPFAQLIEVSNENAPFNPKDNEYYIAGESIEIKNKNYIVCKISDFVYDSDSMNKLGKVKKNKSGVITGIKKA